MGALVLGFDRRKGAGDTGAHIMHGTFVALGVFFDEDFAGYFLWQRQPHLPGVFVTSGFLGCYVGCRHVFSRRK